MRTTLYMYMYVCVCVRRIVRNKVWEKWRKGEERVGDVEREEWSDSEECSKGRQRSKLYMCMCEVNSE